MNTEKRMSLVYLVLILIPINWLANRTPGAEELITISGTVIGPDGPLPNVHIFAEYPPYSATETDELGTYSMEIEAAQIGDIIAIPPIETQLGQQSARLDRPTTTTTLNFTLSPGNWFDGEVVNKAGYPANVDHDVVSTDGRKFYVEFDNQARFTAMLPPDNYTFSLVPPEDSGTTVKNIPVDLTSGHATGLSIVFDVPTDELPPSPGSPNFEDEPAPVASLIQFGQVDTQGLRTITGLSGAIPVAVDDISLVNLSSGDTIVTPVAPNGSFSAQLFAPDEAPIYVKYSDIAQPGQYFRGPVTGTILHAPRSDVADPTSFTISGSAGPDGHWWATGNINDTSYQPGDTITVTLSLTVQSPEIDGRFDTAGHIAEAHLELERLFRADGDPVQRINRGMSTVLAPTGLPIENGWDGRLTDYSPLSASNQVTIEAEHRTENKLEIPLTITGTLPIELPHGLYKPATLFSIDHPTVVPFYGGFHAGNSEMAELNAGENNMLFGLPIISIGTPDTPRLPWTLLSNTFSNGVRGTRALEDQDRFGLSSKIVLQNDALIIPRFDPVSGQPAHFRLEPFLPTISWTMAQDVEPNPPQVPFAFPSGSLTVTILKPDGTTDTLGPSPFVQARNGMTAAKRGYFTSERTMLGLYELTTLNDAFDYHFEQYGRHVITMQGTIEDIWGHTYGGGGTYDVYVARPLDLEPAVFPGTPFEVGDVFNPGVIVHPSVPADVRVDVKLFSNSDPTQLIQYASAGKANDYGFFFPGGASEIVMTAPGEYVVDVVAQYWDDNDDLWMGKVRGASVVASPTTPLVGHGERGLLNVPDPRPPWFFQEDIHPGGWSETPVDIPQESPEEWQTMMRLPYHSGDVVWVAHRNNNLLNELTFQDTSGILESFLLARADQHPIGGTTWNGTLNDRAQVDEMPFIYTTSNGWDDALHPEMVDQMGYFYMAVGRAGVAVRNYVAQDGLFRAYWTTDSQYGRQPGTGKDGDRPGDIKFQFGGGVFRLLNGPSSVDDESHYVIYGSMESIIPMDTEMGNRTMPPFQGNSGGPNGGPLLTLRGEKVDLFITPTGVRPGEILEVGDTFTFAGLVWPTLGAKGTVTVTTPSNTAHTLSGRANKVGYFYVPEGDFTVTEPGIYSVNVSFLYDGQTSAGQVVPPYPHGDVLGSNSGTFHFYVVSEDTPGIEFSWPVREGDISVAPWVLSGNIPTGWSDVKFHYTALMSGFLLEQGSVNVTDDSFGYTFSPLTLHRDFPNLDLELVDTITLSFLVEGRDVDGNTAYRYCRVDIQGRDYRFHHCLGDLADTIFLPMVRK